MNKELDDISDLVSELKNTKSFTNLMVPPQSIATVPEVVNETNVDDFIFRKSSELIQQGVDTMEAMKRTVMSGSDAETIEAYSKLMSSVTGSIEILNKINLQKRKEKATKELKQMDLDVSKKLMDKYGEGGTTNIKNQTNILVASREEIMKALVGKAEVLIDVNKDAIDAEVISVNKQ